MRSVIVQLHSALNQNATCGVIVVVASIVEYPAEKGILCRQLHLLRFMDESPRATSRNYPLPKRRRFSCFGFFFCYFLCLGRLRALFGSCTSCAITLVERANEDLLPSNFGNDFDNWSAAGGRWLIIELQVGCTKIQQFHKKNHTRNFAKKNNSLTNSIGMLLTAGLS